MNKPYNIVDNPDYRANVGIMLINRNRRSPSLPKGIDMVAIGKYLVIDRITHFYYHDISPEI